MDLLGEVWRQVVGKAFHGAPGAEFSQFYRIRIDES
jgi:hypothetical protein